MTANPADAVREALPEVGDWIAYLRGGALHLGVARYVRKREAYPWGREFLTDAHIVHESDIIEVRKP